MNYLDKNKWINNLNFSRFILKTLDLVPQPRMDSGSGNIPEAWKKFKHHLELIFKGLLVGKSAKERCAYLLL